MTHQYHLTQQTEAAKSRHKHPVISDSWHKSRLTGSGAWISAVLLQLLLPVGEERIEVKLPRNYDK